MHALLRSVGRSVGRSLLTPGSLLQTLIDNNIQSAPVYSQTEKAYVGFLDIRDLVSFIRYVHDEQKVHDNGTLHGTPFDALPATHRHTVTDH